MKFAHISDLHLGKRLNGFSMLEEQKYILEEILKILQKEQVSAVWMAGDIYDKPVPPAEAVTLFDDFLVQLADKKYSVFIISGNHDSPERIAFGSRLMAARNIYLSPVYDGKVEPILLEDEHGDINIYMIPFVKPIHVRHFFQEEEIASYTEAVKCAVEHMNVDEKKRNVILAHQFVTGALKSDSEDISVGGLDNVDAEVFEVFDYAALGHIHRSQSMGNERVRYSGTPLKYSFSEVTHEKSVTIVDMKEKGNIDIYTVPLVPQHDLTKIKGSFEEVMSSDFEKNMDKEAYVHVTLTDEVDIPNAFHKLQTVYPNIMQMEYEVRSKKNHSVLEGQSDGKKMDPLELFQEFYAEMNHQPLQAPQQEYLIEKINEIWPADGRGK